MVTIPEVINLVSKDELETDENDVEDQKSPSTSTHKKDDKKDDDDALAPWPGGVTQKGNASGAEKQSERKSTNSPPPSQQKSSHPYPKQSHTIAPVAELFEFQTQKIKERQTKGAQLKALLEEERQLNLELVAKIV